MYKPRYAARNPFFVAPREMFDVASPATRIFQSVAAGGRARRRAVQRAHPSPAPARRGSRMPAGRDLSRERLPAGLPRECVCRRPQAHVIHRLMLRDNGLEPVASRPAEERDSEFLVSRDACFSPCRSLNGPDGALYVADRQDGGDRGRIYRIVPLGFKRPKPPQLGKASTYDLVAMLSHPNGWQRDTAARLLYARQDPAALTLLARVLGGLAQPAGAPACVVRARGFGRAEAGTPAPGLGRPRWARARARGAAFGTAGGGRRHAGPGLEPAPDHDSRPRPSRAISTGLHAGGGSDRAGESAGAGGHSSHATRKTSGCRQRC